MAYVSPRALQLRLYAERGNPRTPPMSTSPRLARSHEALLAEDETAAL
jgi:hypothetical protein